MSPDYLQATMILKVLKQLKMGFISKCKKTDFDFATVQSKSQKNDKKNELELLEYNKSILRKLNLFPKAKMLVVGLRSLLYLENSV